MKRELLRKNKPKRRQSADNLKALICHNPPDLKKICTNVYWYDCIKYFWSYGVITGSIKESEGVGFSTDHNSDSIVVKNLCEKKYPIPVKKYNTVQPDTIYLNWYILSKLYILLKAVRVWNIIM